MISEHCSEFLDTCLDLLIAVLDYDKLLVGFYVRADGTGSHMGFVSKDRIPYIVVMRNLYFVE